MKTNSMREHEPSALSENTTDHNDQQLPTKAENISNPQSQYTLRKAKSSAGLSNPPHDTLSTSPSKTLRSNAGSSMFNLFSQLSTKALSTELTSPRQSRFSRIERRHFGGSRSASANKVGDYTRECNETGIHRVTCPMKI